MASYRSQTAKDFMVRKIFVLRPHIEVREAIRMMLKHGIAGVPVVDLKGKYLGMFSEKHSLSALLNMEYDNAPTTEIGQLMDSAARYVYEDTDLLSIVDIFLNEPYRRLPVIRNTDELVGLVCRRDVLKAFHNGISQRDKVNEDSGILYFSSVRERHESPLTANK